ncbi:Uncharacterised protein [uncultured Comamonas sp.]|nr:Uncharacterised protein [uncultured Comamonas sp.]
MDYEAKLLSKISVKSVYELILMRQLHARNHSSSKGTALLDPYSSSNNTGVGAQPRKFAKCRVPDDRMAACGTDLI